MSAHIDSTYVENQIGADLENALTDASSDVLDQLIANASALVDAALINAGYTPPTSSPPDLVKMATLGALLPQLYSRKKQSVPEDMKMFGQTLNALWSGDLPIPGLTPSAQNAVGGVTFTSSDASVTDSKPKVFGSLRGKY